jgi:hypothetical protein
LLGFPAITLKYPLRSSALDDQYQVYINRLIGMTRLEHYRSQWPLIQPSPKFDVLPNGSVEPVFFPGYTLMTPPGSQDSGNTDFFQRLETVQNDFWQGLPPNLAVPLPLETFHLTIADLIWDSNYKQQVESRPDYETELQTQIAKVLAQQPSLGKPIGLKVLGFMVMTRAIAVCLAPKTEADYQTILNLRRSLYQTSGLLALGIDQQYHFTGHITLGYFVGGEGTTVDADKLSHELDRLNDVFLNDFPEFQLQTVELRKFKNMLEFDRQVHWPTWSL